MIKDFSALLKLRYSSYLLLIIFIGVVFEFASYGLVYPIISIFLNLDQNLIPKINSVFLEYTNYQLNLDKKSYCLYH